MKKIPVPINTERQAEERPGMMSWLLGGAPKKIERQEAEGQRSFVKSETLPTDLRGSTEYNSRAILEAAGVKFVCEVPDDPMFQVVELPAGWEKKPTDHSMWSDLVDDKGRKRASIFYKAAFYDRSAHMGLETRFGIRQDYERQDKENVAVVHVMDCGKVVFATEPIQLPSERSKEYYEVSEAARSGAIAWLDQNYPDWRNPGAYWD